MTTPDARDDGPRPYVGQIGATSTAPQPAARDIPRTLPEVRRHRSLTIRVLLVALGTLSLVLGVIGIFVPGLPTTPFVLLAAACYARASRRFFGWLVSNPTFGPLVLEWHRHRSLPRRVKRLAIGTMCVSLGISIVFFVRPLWLQLAVAALGAVGAFWVHRIPTRELDPDPRTVQG